MAEEQMSGLSFGRRALLWAIFSVLMVLLAYQLQRLSAADIIHPCDFVQYWAAGKLNLSGSNPYDREALYALEQKAGLKGEDTIYFFNPPNTLSLVMPLALLPYKVSRFLFLILQLAILAGCTLWAWRLVGGERRYYCLALVVFATFWPNYQTIYFGQITPLLLVAVLGFLHLQRLGKDFLAGLAASLLTIKPHLLFLFWVALLLWACHRQHCKTVAGVLAGWVFMLIIAWWPNHHILHQYLALMENFWPQDHYLTPSLGCWLRLALGWEHRWLQNMPAVLACLWLVIYYYFRQKEGWDWDQEMPLLILVSCVTTIYGGWIFDLVVIILPVLQLFAWPLKGGRAYRLWFLLPGHLFFNFIWLTIRVGLGEPCIGWVTPILLIVFVWMGRQYQWPLQGQTVKQGQE